MPSAHLTLREEDVVRLALEFLHNRDMHISQLSLERETGVINGVYSDDVLFLRQLILDGQWDDVLEFIQPLETLPTFDMKKFKYHVLRRKYEELLCIKSEATLMSGTGNSVDNAVEEVVKVLRELEKVVPTKEEYSNLCLLLTLPKLNDHLSYKDWNPSHARVQCFREILPIVEKFLPNDKKNHGGGVVSFSKNDRLIQLVIKGILYESCVNYCQSKATGTADPGCQEINFTRILDGNVGLGDSDLSLISWLQCVPSDTFSIPFEQRTLNVDVEKLDKPTLETSWTEHMLVTPIKPKTFPHSAMPFTRPRSAADVMSRSLLPAFEGLGQGLAPSRNCSPLLMAVSTTEANPHLMTRSSFASFHLTGFKNNKLMNTSVDRLFENDNEEVFLSTTYADFQPTTSVVETSTPKQNVIPRKRSKSPDSKKSSNVSTTASSPDQKGRESPSSTARSSRRDSLVEKPGQNIVPPSPLLNGNSDSSRVPDNFDGDLMKEFQKQKQKFQETLIAKGKQREELLRQMQEPSPRLPEDSVRESSVWVVTLTYWTYGERLYCPKEPVGGWPPHRINTTQRLIWLRNEMGRVTSVRGPILNAFIITSDDEHQGEYLPERDKRLQYISGFSGSFGYAVVTKSAAALWTTEKYYALADLQLDCNWELIKLGEPGNPTITDWLKKVLKRALYRIGADPRMISNTMWDEWNRELAADKLALTEVSNNLIDLIWTIGRPAYNPYPGYILPPEYAGDTWQNKVISLRQNLSRFGCDAMIVTALEEIAWLLNIRGRDMMYNPFVKAYLIVERDWLRLYIPKEKISDGVRRQLKIDSYGPLSVRLFPYDMIFTDIRTLSQAWSKVLIPSACVYTPGASQAIVTAVPPEKRFLRQSPIILMKAKKNPTEAEGMRKSNLRDSAAFIDALAHIDEVMKTGGNWTEGGVVRILEKYRKEQNLSQGIAFPTVASFGSHGAFFYYEFNNKTNKFIDDSSTLVLESGGHYYDGTSDVIRTLHFGTPTRDMIEAYTTILSALIQLTLSTFPTSIKTTDLDTVVRSKLWKSGINYRMDVGHGIGFFSNIRESPVMINSDSRLHRQTLKEGYFLTCEPVYVKPYLFGVKLGNVLEVVPHADAKPGKYLALKETTLVPFEQKLIDTSMLSREEVDWLNAYHRRVLQEVGAELKRQSRMKGFYWLMERTKEMSLACSSSRATLPASIFTAFCISLPLLLG